MIAKIQRITAILLTIALVICSIWIGSIDAHALSAEITSVELSTDNLPMTGGEVKISVTGENLTAENWDIDVSVLIEDTDITPSKLDPYEIKDKTAEGATLVVPRNLMRNNLTYTLSVGVGDSRIEKTLTLAKKDYATDGTFNPVSVDENAENNSVRISFDQSITPRGEAETLKSYFALMDSSKKVLENNVADLSFESQAVVVTFESPINDDAHYISIAEGALKIGETTSGDKANGDIQWAISRKPSVSGVALDNEILSNKGGSVVATLEGYQITAVDDSKINAYIMKAGHSSPTDIEVKKSRDDSNCPTLTFELPENTGNKTQTYILKVVYGTTVVSKSIDGRTGSYTVSVLAPGGTANQQTLGALTIAAMTDAGEGDLTDAVANVPSSVGQLKTEVRLYGTNLDRTKTKIRAIDENGIIWPVYDVPECDGVWRFIAIAGPEKNGIFGNGNTQLIELLPPRYAGTNKKYTIQASIDGENWITDTTVSLTIMNDNISGEADFRDCSDANFKYVTVSYEDVDGNKIAEDDVYKGYEISMVQQFDIAPKKIPGYTLRMEPMLGEWVGEGASYKYIYSKDKVETVDIEKVDLSFSSAYCDGKVKAPSMKIYAGGELVASGLTKSNDDFTLTTVASKIPGKYTVKVTGEGKYSGSKSASYTLEVKPTTIASVKGAKKAFTVKAKKQSSAYVSGYQVRYSKFKSMKKAKTTTIGTKYNKNSKKVTKLASKKKYYVQVRSYKTIGGKKYYSAWSAKKSIKTK